MRQIFAIVIIILLLNGCVYTGQAIEPVSVTRIEVDIDEVEELMYRTWKPVHDMTSDYVTMPKVKVRSFEEFLKLYDFTYMDESYVKDNYFDFMAEYDENSEIKLDEEGYIVFNTENLRIYIPTIYDDEVFLVEAYYVDTIYADEDSRLNTHELKITEHLPPLGDPDINANQDDSFRISVFEKNDKDEWILEYVEGVVSVFPVK